MTVQTDPYVRVYYRVLTDDKFRPLSSAAWGHWVRLLVVADGMYPSAAPLPRWVEDGPLRELADARIVDLVDGDYFVIHGMNPERAGRVEAATYAADVKHHGVEEANRRREARAVSSARMRPQPMSLRPDAPAHAEPASPNLSSPSHSEPIHSTPSQATGSENKKTTRRKPPDEERIDFLLDRWPRTADTPNTRQDIRQELTILGIPDPDAEIARRIAA